MIFIGEVKISLISFHLFFLNYRTTSTVYNGHDTHDTHDSSAISKGRYSNDTAENSSHSTNVLNASSESSTNGEHDNDDLSSPYSSTNFTKRLLSLRNRSLGSTINAPPLLDAGKWSKFPNRKFTIANAFNYLN